MDPKDRSMITLNKTYLQREISLQSLEPLLRGSGIFTSFMLDDIFESGNEFDIKENLLKELPTRGPNAFQKFVEILESSGQMIVAAVLKGNNPRESHIVNVRESQIQEQNYSKTTKSITKDALSTCMQVRKCETEYPVKVNEHVYKMNSNPRGFCLIINNVKFEEQEYRFGSDMDALALDRVFQQLGFRVKMERNLAAEDMMNTIKNFSEIKDLYDVDSCVVILLSHGSRNCILGVNEKSLLMDDIFDLFNNENCPALKHKPKMFFIQACRGNNINIGASVVESSDSSVARNSEVSFSYDKSRIPSCSDILISYSTVSGYKAIRHHELGSWYCQELAKVLMDEAWERHLLDILEIVDNKVKKHISCEGEKQATELHLKGWDKKLYFNPGC